MALRKPEATSLGRATTFILDILLKETKYLLRVLTNIVHKNHVVFCILFQIKIFFRHLVLVHFIVDIYSKN